MNAARRKSLEAIWAAIDQQRQELATIIAEEQEAFDNLPESLQGEKGQAMEEGISTLTDAEGELDSALENLTTITQG
ncbi:MAG TPA: hypothetical protein VM680_18490 [Verrucomicrobiae bacterium]|nr:hypothetical protein [Verrucomicrobiae bacterium]